MKIEGAEIVLNQSSLFELESPDKVEHCLIKVKKSEPGIEHPIRIKSDAIFKNNSVLSQIPSPIFCDTESGHNFWGVGGNYCSYEAEQQHDSVGVDTELEEIGKELDKTFKRSCHADDDGETPLAREVWALEDAVRAILSHLKEKEIGKYEKPT